MATNRFKKLIASVLTVMLVANVPCMYVIADEADAVDAETAIEETVDAESFDEENVVEEFVVEEPVAVESAEEADPSEVLPPAPDINISVHVDTSDIGPDLTENDLFEGYFFNPEADDPSTDSEPACNARALTGVEQLTYNYLEIEFAKIAAGKRSSTEIVIPNSYFGSNEFASKDFGYDYFYDYDIDDWNYDAIDAVFDTFTCDTSPVMTAILCNHPYEMYWYDKTEGMEMQTMNIDIVSLHSDAEKGEILVLNVDVVFRFTVAETYQNGGIYTFNTAKAALAKTAASNARAIVDSNKYKTDLQKLTAYKEAICSLVEYNDEAADDDDYPYGDPWQLVWVFDGDTSTNVVCEGYSKAFQYLCDMTNFRRDISCITVYGKCGGGHMWNLVNMDDGKTYMVDITNSDSGTVGSRGGLFIAPCNSGSIREGYRFRVGGSTLVYYYDEQNRMVNHYETWELTISDTAYTEPADPFQSPASVSGRTLDLQGYIVLVFKLNLPSQFVNDPDARIQINDVVKAVPAPSTDGRYNVYYNLAAAQINDVVTLTLLDGFGNKYLLLDKDGNNVTAGYTFSAKEYIDLANAGSSDEALKNMLKYMAEYGKYAQIHFEYDQDDLVLDRTIAREIDSVTADTLINYKAVESHITNTMINYSTSSLNLASSTSINHFFIPASGKTINDYIFMVDGNVVNPGSTGQFTVETSDNRIKLSINNIAAAELSREYVVTIKDKTTGVKQLSLTYSALSYAYRVMEVCGGTDRQLTLQNAVRALYLYYMKADAYF